MKPHHDSLDAAGPPASLEVIREHGESPGCHAPGRLLKRTPEGYTWHHVEDGKTMQLVPSHINNDTPHTGGAAVWAGVVKPAK